MTRFMIWWCLCWCIASMIGAAYYGFCGDCNGVVITLLCGFVNTITGFYFCIERDAEKKESEK